jgi:hypothetical protein
LKPFSRSRCSMYMPPKPAPMTTASKSSDIVPPDRTSCHP